MNQYDEINLHKQTCQGSLSLKKNRKARKRFLNLAGKTKNYENLIKEMFLLLASRFSRGTTMCPPFLRLTPT